MRRLFPFLAVIFVSACITYQPKPDQVIQEAALPDTTQQKFWQALENLCGNTYAGTVLATPPNDTAFTGKKLVMHVRSCEDRRIRVPFFVGNDRSRTWVFRKTGSGIELKHDHRHADGTSDAITMYGGTTAHGGSSVLQVFPADQQTVSLLPAAAGNVWWVELVPGAYFTYNLRRVTTDRVFSIRFDLTKPVETPEAPWGWTD
jgi:hypothetical protein